MLLVYGAYGYTGELIVDLAAERGQPLIVAGRNAARCTALATRHGFDARAFDLDAAADHLDGVTAVLHCAGPFARTAPPMLKACLARGVHYLDITGEIEVFERCAALGAKAESAGIMLLPGAGFDVVPSDCLARHVADHLPGATHLALAILGLGRVSHGTATTVVENLGRGGAVRQDGKITVVPPAHKTRTFDFGRGPTKSVATPWGDVSTAFHSTGIPNIEVYFALPLSARLGMRLSGLAGPLLRTAPVQSYLKSKVDAAPAGPTPAQRAAGSAHLIAEATHPDGRVATARLRTPDGYTLTADAALRLAQRALAGDAPPGFQTPSTAYGPDVVLECDDVTRTDASVAA